MFEMDLRQYQHLELRDLFDPTKKKVTLRVVVGFLYNLPETSLLRKAIAGDSGFLTVDQHIALNQQDSLNQMTYFLNWLATFTVGKKNQRAMSRGIPKRQPRPGDPKEEIVFGTKEDLANMGGFKV